ncbi:MAG: long-chain fatty acid--CoA ligase [Bacteroidota bacterium]|nr:long-chain fatty acid--CoA ligase [Bacteroidota bacterium]
MEPKRLFDLLPRYSANYNKPDMLLAKIDGNWLPFSSEMVLETANLLSYGLFQMGLQKGDKISIISNNRPEWVIANMGLLQAGGINVPVYPTTSNVELEYILNHASVKYVFVSDASLYKTISKLKSKLPSLSEIYTFDQVDGAKHWSEITESGRSVLNINLLEETKQSIKEEDLAVIIYTSGTTANPKGVMLSHRNILSNALACSIPFKFDVSHRILSFLPLNHIFEAMLTVLYIYSGVSIYYAESLEKISDNIREVKPHYFTTVPRLLEKIYDKIVARGGELKGIKRMLFFWALNLGLRYELDGKNGWWYEFQLKIANKIIFNKWREALGGNVISIISGGAALQPRLARIFHAAGIPVMEGYGLTETSPVVAVNNSWPDSICFGTVGPVIKDVEVEIASDGEILVKGPNVMLGYYKDPEATAEAIKDEWFYTGDMGEMVENKFLKITGRKKEIFKTSGGKFISPQNIENALKESRFIDQVMVIGEFRKFPAALIVPDYVFVKEWCRRKGISFTTNQEMSKHERVISRISKEVDKVNKKHSHYEMIKKFELLSIPWTIDAGELTPKQSVKRTVVLKKYQDLIEKIYS